MLALRPYQNEAADFIFERDRSLILAPVGSGKTALTLVAMEAFLQDNIVRRFLVLAPKRVATSVWPVEAPKWAPWIKLAVAVGEGHQRWDAFESKANVVVMNYDNLQWMMANNLHIGFDGVVFDELTRLKNPSGKRFKAFMDGIERFKVRIGLTGSFTSNGLEDTFGQCKVVDQKLLGRSKGAFLQEHFVLINRDYGDWAPRVGALERVMAKIKPATFLLEPGEYKDTLPPLHTVEMRCDLNDRGPYEKMKKDFAVEFPDAKAVAANAAVVTGKLQQMASGFVYDSKRWPNPDKPGKWLTSQTPIWYDTAKLDLLEEVLEGNQRASTIIVYNFQEELAELKRRYPQALTLDDKDALERWNAGKVELLLLHPKSAGHGINAQFGGCRMVFLSLPWSLELYEQTIGRLHRSGQKHDVWVYVLLTNKSMDEKVWAALHDKRAISDIAMSELKC
jgi:hypothetical protein